MALVTVLSDDNQQALGVLLAELTALVRAVHAEVAAVQQMREAITRAGLPFVTMTTTKDQP